MRCLKLYSPVTRYIVEKTLSSSPNLRKKAHEHWRYTSDRVERRLQRTPERPDLWTRILFKGDEKGGLLTLDEHKTNAATLMVAGTETTATALSGLTYYLTMNPPLLERLTREIRSEIVSTEGLKLENLARLKYLQACLMEALRMYPPVCCSACPFLHTISLLFASSSPSLSLPSRPLPSASSTRCRFPLPVLFVLR